MKNYLFFSIAILFFSFADNLIYGSEYLDHYELSHASEFCHNNDQASDLCYLLAQDLLDYQNIYELPLNDHLSEYAHIDFAQAVGVVSIPIFLRYLPILSKLAKNNMIFASTAILVTAAIAFKNYYDTVSDSAMIKIVEGSGSSPSPSKTILELQSSNRYKYYSQKGPEHENEVLIPFFQNQQQQGMEIESHQIKEFQDFIQTAKKRYSYNKPQIDKWAYIDPNFTKVIKDLEIYSKFNNKINNLSTGSYFKSLIEFHPDNLSDFEELIAQTAALRFFNHVKLLSSRSIYYNVLKRSVFYDQLTSTEQIASDKLLNPKKIWDTLLLEHISHLELLEENISPIFEEKIYIPFLKTQSILLSRQLDTLMIKNEKHIPGYDDVSKTDQIIKNFQDSFEPETISSSQPSVDLHSALLPSQYLDYQQLSSSQLKSYLSNRKYMLDTILEKVEIRLDIWNRKGVYKFLPGKAKSDQALRDWFEHFELATQFLLYDLDH